MRPNRRALQFAAGMLVVIALVTFWFLIFPSDNAPPPPADPSLVAPSETASPADVVFPVEVTRARLGTLTKRLTTSGIIRAKREVELIARIAGEIIAVSASNGKFVRQGELLVKLDDREHRVAFDKAKAALLSAQIEYQSLISAEVVGTVDSTRLQEQIAAVQTTFRRAEERYKNGQLTEEEYTRYKRDYEAAMAYYSSKRGDLIANKSGLTQAREMFERAKMNLEWTEIRAPFAGYVANCEVHEHMQVQAGQVLLKLVDISRLFVDVEILESEIGKIHLGRRAELSVSAYPQKTFSGMVAAINPVVDPKTKTVKVTIELKEEHASRDRLSTSSNLQSPMLRPGMFAHVKVETDLFSNRLLVPKEALLVRDQRTLVFVAENGLAKWHYVEVGESNEEFIEIKSGIAPGDSVIVSGHYTLAHDARIRVMK